MWVVGGCCILLLGEKYKIEKFTMEIYDEDSFFSVIFVSPLVQLGVFSPIVIAGVVLCFAIFPVVDHFRLAYAEPLDRVSRAKYVFYGDVEQRRTHSHSPTRSLSLCGCVRVVVVVVKVYT